MERAITHPALRELLPTANPDLLEEAAPFHDAIQAIEWKPSVWSDEGEITFEWHSEWKHAVVSFDGDGSYGYAMLVDGRFEPGAINMPTLGEIPSDLAAYLATP